MDTAKATLPKFIILTTIQAPVVFNRIIYVDNDDKDVHEALELKMDSGEGLYDPRAKIEVEPEPDSDYVHLRFCHNDRYLRVDPIKRIPVATSHRRNNDKSDASSTLFDATVVIPEQLVLKHVSTNLYVQWDDHDHKLALSVKYDLNATLHFLDYNIIVKLPEHVAFRSHNKKYLKKIPGRRVLQFSCDDPNDEEAGFWIKRRVDGYIRIMDHQNKFWRVDKSSNWIKSDQEDNPILENTDGAFWPVKIDNNTIALRSAGGGRFCKRLFPEDESMKDCLSASSSNISNEARLTVVELVLQRNIYDVNYMLKGGRTIDEKPYLSGVTTVVNRGEKDDSVAVEINHQEEEAYTFSRQNSDTIGLSTAFKAGVPFITDSGIQVSYERTTTFQWDTTTNTTTSVKVTDTVPVPANSKAEVHYVGTVGTCRVPFSYTQHDLLPNGNTRTAKHVDGICTGVNCYNFKFEVMKIEPLAPTVTRTLLAQVPVKKS